MKRRNKKGLEKKVVFIEIPIMKHCTKHLIHHFEGVDYEVVDIGSSASERVSETAKVIISEGACGKKYKNQIGIEVWHDSGFIKAAGNQVEGIDFEVDYVVSSSEHDKALYAHAFGTSLDKVLPYGSCRTDGFFDAEAVRAMKIRGFKKVASLQADMDTKKVYTWMPTFRGRWYDNPHMFTALDMPTIDKKLYPDEVLLIKLHPSIKYCSDDVSTVTNMVPIGCKRIFDVTEYDLSELIAISTCLISDYSSSILDGIAIDKPAVFFAEDFDEYSRDRGFAFDYKNEVPNLLERCTEDEFLHAIRTADATSEKYRDFKRKRVGSCDGKAGERIRAFVDSVL